jgi:hypothetical protein
MRRELGVIIHYDLNSTRKLYTIYAVCFFVLTTIQVIV